MQFLQRFFSLIHSGINSVILIWTPLEISAEVSSEILIAIYLRMPSENQFFFQKFLVVFLQISISTRISSEIHSEIIPCYFSENSRRKHSIFLEVTPEVPKKLFLNFVLRFIQIYIGQGFVKNFFSLILNEYLLRFPQGLFQKFLQDFFLNFSKN